MKGMSSSTGGPTGCAQRRAVQGIVHWMSFLRHAGLMNTDLRTDIAELDVSALEDALDALGRPRFHARQIFQWIHRHGVVDFDAMSDLSRELRTQLGGAFTIGTPAVVQQERSVDGTVKFLLRLRDGKRIESVFIPDTPADGSRDARATFCLSTQVGCAMRCAFCLTGKMGIDRNLTAGEIVGQVRVLARELRPPRQPLQHRPHGHGRAAAQLRRNDEGAADPRGRARARRVAAPHHALDGWRAAQPGTAGDRAADAQPRDLAALDDRGSARPARAGEPQVRSEGPPRCVPPLPAETALSASRSSTCC